MNKNKNSDWWLHSIIYMIDILSFQDSNGDGMGDIDGIISRLEYIAGLGVNTIGLLNRGLDNSTDSLPIKKADLKRLRDCSVKLGLRVISNLDIDVLTMVQLTRPIPSGWRWLGKFKQQIISRQSLLSWGVVAFENQRWCRLASCYGKSGYREQVAKLFATLTMTLRGTPMLYYGQELGLADAADGKCYDREPMHWDDSVNAGFTEAKLPWLAISDDYAEVSVAVEDNDYSSILNYYRRLIAWRKSSLILQDGSIQFIEDKKPILCYLRNLGDRSLLVVANLTHRSTRPTTKLAGKIIQASYNDRETLDNQVLRPYEAIVVEL
ncbi:MAG: alpha-amylase family glycosyl hydrolase [Candidatus Saccharibacteria bacterium]|nr:alpha-amylase family glycosyl hydrolase [Candidatus Saccharibacteria bacterium]